MLGARFAESLHRRRDAGGIGSFLTGKNVRVIDHLSIQCSDVDSSAAFYGAVLAPIGGVRVMEFDNGIGFGVPPDPDFWIAPRRTGEGFRESHIAFAAPDRAAVRAFFDAAVAAGVEVLHEPRVWSEYHANYYGAFVRDPDGTMSKPSATNQSRARRFVGTFALERSRMFLGPSGSPGLA